MRNATVSTLTIAAMLLAAPAVHAAVASSAEEIPAAWYAELVTRSQSTSGAAQPVFPSAAYEHGFTLRFAEPARVRPTIAVTTPKGE